MCKSNSDCCKTWRAKNPDRVRVYDYLRRAHKLNFDTVSYSRDEIFLRDLGLCFCGKLVDPDNYEIDHFIPVIYEGGVDAPWNVRIAHPKCNARKNCKMPSASKMAEWAEYLVAEGYDEVSIVNWLTSIHYGLKKGSTNIA